MIVIKRPVGFTMVLRAANAAAYPAETADPLNVDVFWAYADEPQNRRYAGTYPPNSKIKIPLPPDQDRDVVVTTVARSGVGVQQKNDPADAPSSTLQSEREQRKPVIGHIANATNNYATIGVGYYPRHMRARRIIIASDAGFTNIQATYYEDVDKTSAETPRLPEVFRLVRTSPGAGTATYYVKVAHAATSTALRAEATQQLKLEALRWGPDSDPLTVTFADANGAGGSTGTFNPYTATMDGYGSAFSSFGVTIPLPGESSGGVTGTDNGFPDRIAIWNGSGGLTYRFNAKVHPLLSYIDAPGFRDTVSAINVKTNPNYLASGSAYTTTGSINSGQNTLTMANNGHDFRVGQGISVAGAGVAGATLYTTIQAISGDLLTITLNANASTTVSGAAVAHDDQVAIQKAIDDAILGGHRAVFLPLGTYRVRGLTLTGAIHFFGEGQRATILVSNSNAPIIDCLQSSFEFPDVEFLKIIGSTAAGSSQIGLRVDDATYGLRATVRNVWVENCGGAGLYFGNVFSSFFENIFATNCAGGNYIINSPNMPALTFRHCDSGVIHDSYRTGFHIKAGYVLMRDCNSIYGGNNPEWCVTVGRRIGIYGEAAANGSAFVRFEGCNFESSTIGGVQCLFNSRASFSACTWVGEGASSGSYKAVLYDACQVNPTETTGSINGGQNTLSVASAITWTTGQGIKVAGAGVAGADLVTTVTGISGTTLTLAANASTTVAGAVVSHTDDVFFPLSQSVLGEIDDDCGFSNSPATYYANSEPIHVTAYPTTAAVIPPLTVNGRGPKIAGDKFVSSFRNDTTSDTWPLLRKDAFMAVQTITASTTFVSPGVRCIECNHAAPITITLYWPGWALNSSSEMIVIKDVSSAGAAANNITIQAAGGSVNGSTYTINVDKGTVVLVPNSSGDYRIVATYPASLPSNVVKKTGGGLTDFIPIFAADDTITGGPMYRIGGNVIVSKDAIIAETDNAQNIGGDGFNRFRDIFAAGKFKGPAFVTPGANGMYGGSADPEGNQTAEPGSIYLRTNGNLHKKTSGSGNTGWTLISTGVGVSGSGLATFFTQFTNDSTIEAAPMYESGGSIVSQEFILPETNNSKDLGSAALKWRTGYFGTKVQTVTYEFTNGVTIITGTGSPEGAVSAFAGSLYLDDGGALYRKSSGSGNTGWTLVSNAGLANTALSNLAGVAINAALIANTNNAYDLGSAALKWRTGYFGTKIQTVVFEFTNGLTLTTGSGNPEGVVSAFLGSLYLDDSGGILYRKASGFGNTGWSAVGGANTALSNLASVAINASLIANANNTLDLGSTGTRWRTGYFGTSLVTPLLALESRTDPGSPANGDAWTSSDRNAVSVRIAGQTEDVVTSMWRNSAAASFDTTLTETSLLADTGVGTKTLAANRLKVGNQVRVKLAGLYGTKASSPGNFTIKLKNGATTMVTISAFGLPTNVVDQNWWIEAVGTVTATGASGNILWTINFYYNDGTGTLKGRPYTANSAIIDTTASKLIDVTGQFTVSDIANYWETTTASIELVA